MSMDAAKSKEHTVSIGDVALRYWRAGPQTSAGNEGSARTLILLHGSEPFSYDASSRTHAVISALTEHFDVIAPTFPGFGGTPLPAHFDGMDDLVYSQRDLIESLGVQDAIVIGFSFGGWVALEMAVQRPSWLSQLVLVDSLGIKPGGREDRDIADVFALPLQALNERLYHDPSNAPDLAGVSDDALMEMASNRTALALYGWDPYMHNPKLPHRLHRISAPVAVIWGESDGVVTSSYGRALVNMLPDAAWVTVPSVGHLPQEEAPNAFLSTLRGVVPFPS